MNPTNDIAIIISLSISLSPINSSKILAEIMIGINGLTACKIA